jgi:hypothetical protein
MSARERTTVMTGRREGATTTDIATSGGNKVVNFSSGSDISEW